ncbi:DUF3618 domain-containing protein [Kitasatospora sp. NPDC051914]|uniref:DUF3618 domain-containing protein n=1 Tax=Kitasatospora sp. NPDC051914 TaxID=3154945 RepID=UPI00342F40CE
MTGKNRTDGAGPTTADLASQIADTRDRLADTVEELAAKADVGARVRDAAEQVKERAGRAAGHARERAGRTADHTRHALEERIDSAGHTLRASGSRMKEQASALTGTAGAAVGRHSESSARELALQTARYGGPVLAAVGGAMLGTAAVLALARRRC